MYLPPELIEEIMLLSDTEALPILCQLNNNTKELCVNKFFWHKKYSLYNLPTIKYLKSFTEYKNHYNTNDENTYISIYKDLLESQKEAIDAFNIYMQNYKTTFTIVLAELNLTEQI